MAVYYIQHKTTYRYESPVTVSHHTGHMEPLQTLMQECRFFRLDIDPVPAELAFRTDYFGNRMHYFSVHEPHQYLTIEASSEVSVVPVAPYLAGATPTCGEVSALFRSRADEEHRGAEEFVHSSPRVPFQPEISKFGQEFLSPYRPVLEAALGLAQYLYETFEFDPTATDVDTPVGEFLKLKRGVCQDFAHFMLACLRSAGLPARYVSGYILTVPPPGMAKLQGADASHAWVSLYVPGTGWVDIDPTNNLICSDQHITVAIGRDYGDVSVVRGDVVGGGKQSIKVEVTVTPR